MKPYLTHEARKAQAWWARWEASRQGPGAMARMRRARSPVEAMMHEEAIELVMLLAPNGPWPAQERAAGLASLLAHVRQDDPTGSVAGKLGGPVPDERLMKPVRFRRLMEAEAGAERLDAFRRAVHLLRLRANVADLANGWLLWDHPTQGDRTRAHWMLRYAGAGTDDGVGKVLDEVSGEDERSTEDAGS